MWSKKLRRCDHCCRRVVATRQHANYKLHTFLIILTLGLWIPVYTVLAALYNTKERQHQGEATMWTMLKGAVANPDYTGFFVPDKWIVILSDRGRTAMYSVLVDAKTEEEARLAAVPKAREAYPDYSWEVYQLYRQNRASTCGTDPQRN
jgi:hypothetical protein